MSETTDSGAVFYAAALDLTSSLSVKKQHLSEEQEAPLASPTPTQHCADRKHALQLKLSTLQFSITAT